MHAPQRAQMGQQGEQLSLFGPSVALPRWEPPDALGGTLALALICIPWLLIGWLIYVVA